MAFRLRWKIAKSILIQAPKKNTTRVDGVQFVENISL
jgi:hypothetical protein